MNKLTLAVACALQFILLPCYSSAKDLYPRNPDLDIIHYCFRISLNDSTDQIEGLAGITCTLAIASQTIELDLVSAETSGNGMTVDRVMAGSNPLKFRHANNRIEIEIPEQLRSSGQFSFSVRYSGIPADGLIISKNKFGERTFFADNWPDRARYWLPCADHPSDKATVEFIVTAPEKYRVVSNGYLAGEYPGPGSFASPRRVTHWKEDVPVPTKVMVIGAANFAWSTAGWSKGIPVQSWVYAQNREAGFTDYQPACEILTYYQDLIGPYSYEKLANVQSKTMFGGMENSGCIFYYEGSVSGKNNLRSLLAHEIAHQWFGDAVTENDWHHIWLSEGFATYLEACYADSMIPDRDLDASMAAMKKDVIGYFETTNRPVIDTTIQNNMDLLNTNSYQKGAWVLHMLRQEIGETEFWTGIRNFYKTYRDKNAMTSDFRSVMEEASGRSLQDFFHQWLEIPGQPVIRWSWTYHKKKGMVNIEIEQIQEQHNFVFTLPVELFGSSDEGSGPAQVRSVICRIPVHDRLVHFTLPVDFPITDIRLDSHNQLLFKEEKKSR